MPADDVIDIIAVETPFRGHFRVDRYHFRHRMHDGGWSRPMTREVFERGHAVALLLYDPDRDALVMIEQFRIGAYAGGGDALQIEIVAGIIESGEALEDVARRETLEEAGLHLLALEQIGKFWMTPGGSSESIVFYIGRVDSAQAGGIHGADVEDEDIRVFVQPVDDALATLAAGRIQNATTVIALQWLALNRDHVRALWR